MRKQLLSPSASVMMSLALALGILVADLANVRTISTASAQTVEAAPVAEATVVRSVIGAKDVLVGGVPTSGVFVGSIKVVDSLLVGDTASLTGVHVNDSPSNLTGVHVNDLSANLTGVHVNDLSANLTGVHVNDSPSNLTGVHVNDLSAPTGGTYTIIGGTVEGQNVKVVDGVITGDNLRVVGAVVSGSLDGIVVTPLD